MTSIVHITGATGGNGQALSRQLYAQGLRVTAVGRDANRLANVEAHAHIVGSTLNSPLHRTPTS